MDQRKSSNLTMENWLQTLGVELLCQCDVLVFLHRHQASLISAEHIARLLGYPTGEVVAALDGLESLGLVNRSRVNQGVRLYQSTVPADSRRGDALGRLLDLADSRAGRLLLAQKLPRSGRRAQGHNGRSPPEDKGSATLRQAI